MAIDIPWMEGVGSVEYIWTSIAAIAATSFIAAVGLTSFWRYRTKTMFWFFSAFFTIDLLLIIEFAANLLANTLLLRVAYSLVVSFWLLSETMFIAHLVSVNPGSHVLMPIIVVMVTINVIMLDPATEISMVSGSFIISNDLAVIPFYAVPLVVTSLITAIAFVIYRESPDFVRRSTLMLFLVSFLNIISGVFSFVFPYAVLMIFDSISTLSLAIVICKHPGLFSIVSYRTQYFVLIDENDDIVFDFWWRRVVKRGAQKAAKKIEDDAEIKEMLLATMGKVGSIVPCRLKTGLVVEFVLDHGVCLVYKDPRGYKIGIFTRFSSQALRDGIKILMAQIEALLKTGSTDSSLFASAIEGMMKTKMIDIRSTKSPTMALDTA